MKAFEKDAKGRVSICTEGEIIPKSRNDVGYAAARNHAGMVFVDDGAVFDVIVRVDGDEFLVASGIAVAESGKMCRLRVKVRASSDATEPVEPVIEPVL